jgi:tRNA (cmo5U34)-methyltransferase
MPTNAPVNLWTCSGHASDYLGRADSIPHRSEGESTLLEFIPANARRVLDLGTGDGRLLALVKSALAGQGNGDESSSRVEAVAVDFSPAMLEAAGKRFAGDSSVTIVSHNLDHPLPELGKFDAVVSSFAIHHLVHERKRELYGELHEEFLSHIGKTGETEDPSNKLLDLETQLQWLREIGFVDVDCHWKWRELALLVGSRP